MPRLEVRRFHMQEVIHVSRSKPYSSISVKSVDVSVLAQSHAGQACVFGLDVAKFELMGVIRWPDGSFTKPWRIVNPDELLLLMGKLKELRERCPVTVALESSGTYGDALRQAACDAGIPTRRVSAKAVKDQAETFDGVPSQHDGKDGGDHRGSAGFADGVRVAGWSHTTAKKGRGTRFA